jgi:uncharacterized protein (TIGR03118 family)
VSAGRRRKVRTSRINWSSRAAGAGHRAPVSGPFRRSCQNGASNMNRSVRASLRAGVMMIALTATVPAQTQMPRRAAKQAKPSFYIQTNLVSSMKSLKAKIHDKNLLNPWGLAQGPTPFWVSDNNAGVATLYTGTGKIFTASNGKKQMPFVVEIPPPRNSTAVAAPSGIVFNGTTADFGGDEFIFSTEDGTISGWQESDGTGAVLHVDNSETPTAATGAVYKGLAIATVNGNQFIYATNFRAGTIDVFDGGYNPASLTGTFSDPNQLAGYGPFGITLFGTNLWVSYALQDAAKHDPIHQAGAGYIDIFTTDGVFQERFATGGNLNAPWGMVLTPTNFGSLSNDYWIGNFGDGMINAFDAAGNAVGQPSDQNGQPVNIDGLWALVFGNGGNGASTSSLYFTAGPNMESQGIFGELNVKSKSNSPNMPGMY